MYDLISEAHIAIEHSGRSGLSDEMTKKYADITRKMIAFYL